MSDLIVKRKKFFREVGFLLLVVIGTLLIYHPRGVIRPLVLMAGEDVPASLEGTSEARNLKQTKINLVKIRFQDRQGEWHIRNFVYGIWSWPESDTLTLRCLDLGGPWCVLVDDGGFSRLIYSVLGGLFLFVIAVSIFIEGRRIG